MSRERTPEPSEAPAARERTTTTTTAEITVPADTFALRETMTQLDGIAFEIERVVASDDEWSGCGAPFVRVNSPEHGSDGIEAAFDEDSSIGSYELLADLGDEWLYRLAWTESTRKLVRRLVSEEGTLLSAAGTNEQWHLSLLFPDREALARTYECCEEAGVIMDIARISTLDGKRDTCFGLTDN